MRKLYWGSSSIRFCFGHASGFSRQLSQRSNRFLDISWAFALHNFTWGWNKTSFSLSSILQFHVSVGREIRLAFQCKAWLSSLNSALYWDWDHNINRKRKRKNHPLFPCFESYYKMIIIHVARNIDTNIFSFKCISWEHVQMQNRT